jgi:hypothetical protein
MSQSEHGMQGTGNRGAAQWALRDLPRRPAAACFSYSAGMPLSDRPATPGGHGTPCFAYSDGMPPGDRPRLPEGKICFSYSAGTPLGIRNRNAAERVLRSLPRMPTTSHCFRY